eukprot:182426_1
MGSSLQITDIYIQRYWTKPYILAMRMLEQIMNGYFIDGGTKAERALSALFDYVLGPTMMERINATIACNELTQFLVQEEFDTDSILDDIENQNLSNLVNTLSRSDSQQTKIQKIKQSAII